MSEAGGTPVNPSPMQGGGERVAYVQPPPAPRRRSFLRTALVWVLGVIVVVSLVMNIALFGMFGALCETGGELREKYVSGGFTDEHKVVIIGISGVITEGSPGVLGDGEPYVENIVQQLKKARQDKKVVGIVLEVNSPGGSATASDLILHEIVLTKMAGKRVVAWMGSVAASGGYYVSCKSDAIYAAPTCLTGSIGVILNLFDVQGLSDKIGFKMKIIKCGKFKDMGSPFREMEPAEQKKFQDIADDVFDNFKRAVKEGRRLSDEEIDRIADGSVISASEALKVKLVDKLDYIDAAVDDARGPYRSAAVVRYRRPSGLMAALLSSKASGRLEVHVDTPFPSLSPGLYYLWMPGLPAEK